MKNIDSINGLINKNVLQLSINNNNNDPYGSACVNIAINVMHYLDNFKQEFNIGYYPDMTTPHGIICQCDDQGGITGYMASTARNIVTHCHVLGWKFYLADVLNNYNIQNQEIIEKNINNLVKANLIEYNQAKLYVDSLIQRYNDKVSVHNVQ